MSIHPSIIFRLSKVWSWRQGVQEANPDIPLPSNTLQLLMGHPKAFLGQKGYIILPASSGAALGPPPTWTCPTNLQRGAARRHPNKIPEPPQLTLFDVMITMRFLQKWNRRHRGSVHNNMAHMSCKHDRHCSVCCILAITSLKPDLNLFR